MNGMGGGRGGRARAPAPVPPSQPFLEEHRAPVYRFLRATVGGADADDCFQETFLAALRAYPRLRDGEHLRSWVFTIATRKAIDAGRARARRPVPSGESAGLDAPAQPDPPPDSPDPADPLGAAVRGLPGRQRAAV